MRKLIKKQYEIKQSNEGKMAKPKSSASAKSKVKTLSTIEKAKQDKTCEISASIKKQFKVLTKPTKVKKSASGSNSGCISSSALIESIENGEVVLPKTRSKRIEVGNSSQIQASKPKSLNTRKCKTTRKNNAEEKAEDQPIKKFFSAKEKTYKIPHSPTKSNDIYDFLSLTNKAERRESDPILKKIIANKNVDLKVYKKGKIISKRGKKKPVKSAVAEPPPIEDEEVVIDDSTDNFSFNNVVNSTPAVSTKTKSTLTSKSSQSPMNFPSSSPLSEHIVQHSTPQNIETTFKSPPLKNDLRRNAILNSNRQRTVVEKRMLLEQVRKVIPRMSSTPLAKKPTFPHTPKAISPIAPLINPTMRIEDEENYDLPHLNYFGRSSDMTPSFSSDVIPQTPQKSSLRVINNSNEENIFYSM